jgi:hypothetical protein
MSSTCCLTLQGLIPGRQQQSFKEVYLSTCSPSTSPSSSLRAHANGASEGHSHAMTSSKSRGSSGTPHAASKPDLETIQAGTRALLQCLRQELSPDMKHIVSA